MLANPTNPLIIFDYLSSNNPDVLTVFDALMLNLIYKIQVTIKFKMSPRQNDPEVYYMKFRSPVIDAPFTNFPQCYASVHMHLTKNGFFIHHAPTGLC